MVHFVCRSVTGTTGGIPRTTRQGRFQNALVLCIILNDGFFVVNGIEKLKHAKSEKIKRFPAPFLYIVSPDRIEVLETQDIEPAFVI
jgi:hypothetical protein